MPVKAQRAIRKMRGGAQAHLIQADDGRCYVVKFRNNPQHRRILVNEIVSSVFLRYLRISTPSTVIVQVTEEFLAAHPDVYIQLGARHTPVEPGRHFGSAYPGDPDRLAVYDFIPDALLGTVVNLPDFLAVLVLDKWMGNADARQSIFFRARVRDWMPATSVHPLRLGFVAQMVDHGYMFDGPHWEFADAPLQGLYFRPLVYEKITGYDDFQPWLDQVRDFPEEVFDEACRQVPPEWLEGDEHAFERLLERLYARRRHVPDLINGCRSARVSPFPNWR